MQSNRKSHWSFLIGLTYILAMPAVAAETYIYKEKDGTRWITDRPMDPEQYVFINKFGRPTATRSCSGVTPKILEQRARTYMPTIKHYASVQKIDPLLIKAVITVESCFDARASSHAGARGLMQLMAGTAKPYGVTNRFDPTQNLRAGIQHLRELLEDFDYDLSYALAAYNAGSGNVRKYNGIPPFRETQKYVKKVLKYYQKYSNASKPSAPAATPIEQVKLQIPVSDAKNTNPNAAQAIPVLKPDNNDTQQKHSAVP